MTITTKWEEFKMSVKRHSMEKERKKEEYKEAERKAMERKDALLHSYHSSGSETLDD